MRTRVGMNDDGRVTEPDRRSWLTRLLSRPPDPHRPVDHAYVQRRWVRLHGPGPWRAATVVVTVLGFALVATTVAAAALAVPAPRLQRLVVLVVAALLLAGVGVLVLRVLTSGVYVTDAGVRLITVRRTVVLAWRQVQDVRRVPARVPLLGLGWLPVQGEHVLLVLTDGSDLGTTLTTWSPDFAGRYEAYDIAAMRLERWWQAGRG